MKKKAKKALNIKVGIDNFQDQSNNSVIFDESNSTTKDYKGQRNVFADQEGLNSINLAEIKYYEEHSPKKYESNFSAKKKKVRNEIASDLEDEYPYLNSTELYFLSCVVLIQRKWR